MSSCNTPHKVLIVGGVALGAGVAAKVRRISEQAEIVIVEKGPYVSFGGECSAKTRRVLDWKDRQYHVSTVSLAALLRCV